MSSEEYPEEKDSVEEEEDKVRCPSRRGGVGTIHFAQGMDYIHGYVWESWPWEDL